METITKYNANALKIEKEVPVENKVEVFTKEMIIANLAAAIENRKNATKLEEYWLDMMAKADEEGLKTSEEMQIESLENNLE